MAHQPGYPGHQGTQQLLQLSASGCLRDLHQTEADRRHTHTPASAPVV